MTDHPPTSSRRRRGPVVAAAVLVAVLVAAVVAVLVLRDDDSGGSSERDDAATTTSPSSSPAPETTDVPAETGTVTVPIERIEGATADEVCAAVLVRLEAYADVARATPVPDASVVNNFDQFTDEIFTLADGAEWGDRIIEELVTVRREWSNAAAAASSDDPEAAADAGAAALAQLEATIDGASCPAA